MVYAMLTLAETPPCKRSTWKPVAMIGRPKQPHGLVNLTAGRFAAIKAQSRPGRPALTVAYRGKRYPALAPAPFAKDETPRTTRQNEKKPPLSSKQYSRQGIAIIQKSLAKALKAEKEIDKAMARMKKETDTKKRGYHARYIDQMQLYRKWQLETASNPTTTPGERKDHENKLKKSEVEYKALMS